MKTFKFMFNGIGETFTQEFENEEEARNWCEDKPISFIGVAYRLGWKVDERGNRLYEEDVR